LRWISTLKVQTQGEIMSRYASLIACAALLLAGFSAQAADKPKYAPPTRTVPGVPGAVIPPTASAIAPLQPVRLAPQLAVPPMQAVIMPTEPALVPTDPVLMPTSPAPGGTQDSQQP
jgi:hypothetical protein